jgi:DNA-binding MarR family transcriptional regulator
MNDVTTTTRLGQFIQSLHVVEARLEASLEPLGLSLAKFGALAQLAAAGEPLPLSTLAERRACVRSNITQLVDRLEAEGLVKRSDDPRDRRSVRAELTAEGHRRYEAGLKALGSAERDLFKPLGNPDRDKLLELLAALRAPR